MLEKEKHNKIKAVSSDPLAEVNPKEIPSKTELRKRIRFVFRECSNEDWDILKDSIQGLGYREQKGAATSEQTIGYLESIYRRGETGSLQINNIIQKVLDKIIASPGVLGEVNGVYERLSKIPDVSASTAISVLKSAGEEEREKIIGFVPLTGKSERNRDFIRDRALGLSHNELAAKHDVAHETSKTLTHTILKNIVARPLARQAILDIKKRIDDSAVEEQKLENESQETVPDIPRATIRKLLPKLSDEEWVKIEEMIPLNPTAGKEGRDRNAARRYFRDGISTTQLAGELDITKDGVKSKIGAILDNLRGNPDAREIILEHLNASGIRDFEQMLREFRDGYGSPKAMMEDNGLTYGDGLKKALQRLPKEKKAADEWERKLNKDVEEKGQMIPAFASFIRTHPPEVLESIISHFEENLLEYGDQKTLGLQDMPRLALYYVLACHVGKSQGITDRRGGIGEHYRRVGEGYRQLIRDLSKKTSSFVMGRYSDIESRYLNIARAIGQR